MKVWIIFQYEANEGSYIEGIYSTKEKAIKALENFPEDTENIWYDIQERIVE